MGGLDLIKELCVFEANECINDVKWSPCHPAIIGAVDATGTLILYNLIEELEVIHSLINCDLSTQFQVRLLEMDVL